VDVIRDKEHLNSRVEECKKQMLALTRRARVDHGLSLCQLTTALQEAAQLLELPSRTLGAYLPLTNPLLAEHGAAGGKRGKAPKAPKAAGGARGKGRKQTRPPKPEPVHDLSAGAVRAAALTPGYLDALASRGWKRAVLAAPATAPASGASEEPSDADEGGASAAARRRVAKRRAGAWRVAPSACRSLAAAHGPPWGARARLDLLGFALCTLVRARACGCPVPRTALPSC
jgi:hypothetical protein